MRRICLFLSLSLGLSTCLACSAHREAGTRDIAFRLVWDGQSDLDLYVEDPAGTCICGGVAAASGVPVAETGEGHAGAVRGVRAVSAFPFNLCQ